MFLVGASSALQAQQDDPAAFYKGKVVRLVVGVGVGSGYDINARVLARHLPNTFPGSRPSSCRTSRARAR